MTLSAVFQCLQLHSDWEQYKSDNPSGREFEFSQALGNFFDTTPNRKCTDVNDGNCGVSLNCGQKDL